MEIKTTFVLSFCLGFTFLVISVPRPRNDIHTLSRQVNIIKVIIITSEKNPITPGKAIKHELLEFQRTGQVDSGLAELKGWTKVGLETIM